MRRLHDVHLGAVVGGLTVLALTIPVVGLFGAVGVIKVIQALGVGAIAASAYFAYGLLRTAETRNTTDVRRAESASMLNEAITALERSYRMFTRHRTGSGAPSPDRLLWLTVARMLLGFEELKSRVTESDHQSIIEEQEQYWRYEFYALLEHAREALTVDYFRYQDGIEDRSILVIYAFARWPEHYPDRVAQIHAAQLLQAGVIPINHFGAREYLEI